MKTRRYITGDGLFGVILTPSIISDFLNCCSLNTVNEVGGVVIGFYDTMLKNAIITQIKLIPGKFLKFQYQRNGKKLSRILKRAWQYSRGTEYYVGEWHTHPGMKPISSTTDKKNLLGVANSTNDDCPHPLLFIIGNKMNVFKKDLKIYIVDKNEKIQKVEMIMESILSRIWRR